jgi:hypothetical protein
LIDAVAVTAVHVTFTDVFPPETVGASIVSGVVDGVTEEDAADAALSPMFEPVVTVHVRATPFVRPVTTTGELVPVALRPPQEAVYWLTDAPFVAPPENATDTCPFPAVTPVTVGAVGAVAAVTEVDAEEANAVHAPPPVLQPSRPVSIPDVGVEVTRIS